MPSFEIFICRTDKVKTLKRRVAVMHLIPFKRLEFALNGSVVDDELQLCELGIDNFSKIDLVVNVSESGILDEIFDILRAHKSLYCQELSLLYSHKYGMSIDRSLKIIGNKGNLQDFLRRNLVPLERGRVTLKNPDTIAESGAPTNSQISSD